jgi:hypothetical protein
MTASMLNSQIVFQIRMSPTTRALKMSTYAATRAKKVGDHVKRNISMSIFYLPHTSVHLKITGKLSF